MSCSPFALSDDQMITVTFVAILVVIAIWGLVWLYEYARYDIKGRARPGSFLEIDEKAEARRRDLKAQRDARRR